MTTFKIEHIERPWWDYPYKITNGPYRVAQVATRFTKPDADW